MTTMGMRVIRAGHDTPKTSKIASNKKPKGSAVWRKPKNLRYVFPQLGLA